jgi:hypothetical protein
MVLNKYDLEKKWLYIYIYILLVANLKGVKTSKMNFSPKKFKISKFSLSDIEGFKQFCNSIFYRQIKAKLLMGDYNLNNIAKVF